MYNEESWLRLLFLVSDTQAWIKEMEQDMFSQIPNSDIKKMCRKSYYLSAAVFAHIIERHYYKIPRHPSTGKFTISVCEILHWLRESFYQQQQPLTGSCLLIRQWDTGSLLGFDRMGQSTTVLTILSERSGQIKTAFPGEYECKKLQISAA